MDPSDIPATAGDFVAGDMDEAEAVRFAASLEGDADRCRVVTWWRNRRHDLARHGRPPSSGPDPDLCRRLHCRLRRQGHHLRWPDPWRWAGWAAAAVLLIALWPDHDPAPSYFDETGRRIQPSPTDTVWHEIGNTPTDQPTSRPWLGLAGLSPTALPEEVVRASGLRHGLIVFRVEGPAAAAGIRPGDLILAVASCPTFSGACIRNALRDTDPGTAVTIRYWSIRDGTVREAPVPAGEIWQ